MTEAYEGDGFLVNSGPFTGMDSAEARETIANISTRKGLGGKGSNYRFATGEFRGSVTGERPSRSFTAIVAGQCLSLKKTFLSSFRTTWR